MKHMLVFAISANELNSRMCARTNGARTRVPMMLKILNFNEDCDGSNYNVIGVTS